MKKITAKELSTIMSEIAEVSNEWYEFVDNVAYSMVNHGYAEQKILDPEYVGDEYEYIFSQANNFWKVFKKKEF